VATGLETQYIKDGMAYDYDRSQLLIDMAQPRTITVVGINSLTGKEKIYILKVTEKGICLV
jgi:hypothetical protein